MLQLLRSVRLFLFLLVVFLAMSAIATLVPQGLDESWYVGRFGPGAAGLLKAFGLTTFFSSPHFLILMATMELNLLLCTMPRLVRRVRVASEKEVRSIRIFAFAPDVIHLGLVVVVAGGMLSATLRQTERFLVPVGTTVHLGDSGTVTVADARQTTDSLGNVVGWTITLRHQDGSQELKINAPIRLAGHRIHFFHFSREPVLYFIDSEDRRHAMRVGEGVQAPDGRAYVLAAIDGEMPRFDVLSAEGEVEGHATLRPGEFLGQFRFDGAAVEVLAGFSATRDPGRPFVFVGLMVVVLGLLLYSGKLWRSYG